MKAGKLAYYMALLLMALPLVASSQMQIDTAATVDYLVKEVLLGEGVIVGNVKYSGKKLSIAHYTDPDAILGIKEGIILSSGNAYYATGPNKSQRSGWVSGAPGDRDLDGITAGRTYDAAVLEFDFVTSAENLTFHFVFASEEYLEYVGSKFNDVFGFFVEGPGLPKTNIARLPDGKTPITINNVNHELNVSYYVDNTFQNTTDPFIWDVRNRKVIKNVMYLKEEQPPPYNTQFDGFTVVLEAKCKVIPDEVYHIKMAVADVADAILDSGVFLKGGSFSSTGKKTRIISKTFEKQISKVLLKPIEIPINTVPEEKDPTVINVEFAFDKFDLPDTSVQTVKQVYEILSNNPSATVEVSGHTDSHGSDEYNIRLSQQRSAAVAKQLKHFGTPETKIKIKFHGETSPIKSNITDEGRARNRRVEFKINYQP